jgi:stage III sporulation protein SpoIIIAA
MEYHITDDLEKLKAVLPDYLVDALENSGRKDDLSEVILDLGRVPTARFIDREVILDQREITREDIDYVVTRIGVFDGDNRAGLERTLHRISAIRNRRKEIVGLTCRIGRAVYGTIDIVQDLIESGQSVLILGAPGVGKTTLLREAARVLAEHRRVVIVDTSNEIGGDGDVPHPAVGRARRMQVSDPTLQHEVMIEAVENHNPEVIVIDEIGRALEAEAARTIAERGVQLVGTAHGQTLSNLMLNPTLSDLIGGIESVTLSDEEARRRNTQKVVQERRLPPTFDVLIELQSRHRLMVHEDVAAAVDNVLRGRSQSIEIRYRTETGEIVIENQKVAAAAPTAGGNGNTSQNTMLSGNTTPFGRNKLNLPSRSNGTPIVPAPPQGGRNNGVNVPPPEPPEIPAPRAALQPIRVYPFGVARNRLQSAAKRMKLPLIIEDDFSNAQAVLTLKTYYRQHPKVLVDAEQRGLPILVLRANTATQMEILLADLWGIEPPTPPAYDDPLG